LTGERDAVAEINVAHASTTVMSEKCATNWRYEDVTDQKEQIRANRLDFARRCNERRRQLLERAEQ
jgi:hypothetical protein